ncbi:MAG: pilus assembly protein [Armatimonadetes bacterium]|nr:pilus assembly protein [Armatimonadota bacterium]
MRIRYITQRAGISRSGATTVELALVAPLLIFLLFGIIEFGLMVKDVVGLNQAAREAARVAAVGGTPSTLDARVREAAPTINGDNIVTLYERRTFNEDTGTWTEWTALGVSDGENDAAQGDQIKVTLTYPHPLATGALFSGLADNPDEGTITLKASIIMLRE